MLVFICFIVLAQAYVFQSLIPVYHVVDINAVAATSTITEGLTYLLVLAGVLLLISFIIIAMNRSKVTEPEIMQSSLVK